MGGGIQNKPTLGIKEGRPARVWRRHNRLDLGCLSKRRLPWLPCQFITPCLPAATHTPSLTEKYSIMPIRKGELPLRPDTLVQKMESGAAPAPRAAEKAAALVRLLAQPSAQGLDNRLQGGGSGGAAA